MPTSPPALAEVGTVEWLLLAVVIGSLGLGAFVAVERRWRDRCAPVDDSWLEYLQWELQAVGAVNAGYDDPPLVASTRNTG